METKSHWQQVYSRKSPDEQTWYQPRPDISIELIEQVVDEKPVRLVDIGGGASTLVDHLLDRGGFEVHVVDIAPASLEASQKRLGERADQVDWVAADLTAPLDFDQPFDIWHDRAVFHFLVDEEDRKAYFANLERHLARNGHLVMATFAPGGPEKCSGLPVQHYSAELLAETLGDSWQLLDSRNELHPTPWGGEQAFSCALFKRV